MVFEYACDDILDLLSLSKVSRKWSLLVYSFDDTLVKKLTLKSSRFIKLHDEDFEPTLRRLARLGPWFNAGMRYLLVCQTLEPKKPVVIRDHHLKFPDFDKIPYNFGPVEQIHSHCGREIPGLNNEKKAFLRQFDLRQKVVDDACVLDFDNRKFEYIELEEPSFGVSQTEFGLEIRLAKPGVYYDNGYGGCEWSVRKWRIPKEFELLKNEDDRLRLLVPRGGEMYLIRKTWDDKMNGIIKVGEYAVEWKIDYEFRFGAQFLMRPGLDVFVVVDNLNVKLFCSKTGDMLVKKRHMINIIDSWWWCGSGYEEAEEDNDAASGSVLDNELRTYNSNSDDDLERQDWRLTDTHLLYYYNYQRRLVACPLEKIVDTPTMEWTDVLHIDVPWLGANEDEVWGTVDCDSTDRFVILNCNQLAGLGMIIIDLFTGVVKSYALDVEDLDIVQAAKYNFQRQKSIKHPEHSFRLNPRKLQHCHDGLWAIDRQGDAVYISMTRLTMVKNLYNKLGCTGPVDLVTLGPWIEAMSSEPKLGFWGRTKKKLSKKQVRLWK